MQDPSHESIEKRAGSFRALFIQDGQDHYRFTRSVAESYEWMRQDRDEWKALAMGYLADWSNMSQIADANLRKGKRRTT